MEKAENYTLDLEIAELERLIKEFKEKFTSGTSDVDDFITISQIEMMWGELRDKTNNIYSDMLSKMMSDVDESDIIRKKKENIDSGE
jgi:translation initiation factor 1 (eIF-1/SUI1)